MVPNIPDVHQWENLSFPKSLPHFMKLFPDDAACATYLEGARWPKGFTCPHCEAKGEPFRFAAKPGVLRCRKCRKDVALTAGTVMQRTHTPLTTWFWGAYLVSSMTPGVSAVQFQKQLGLTRYETAFQLLHKLRAGMVRPGRDRIGGNLSRNDHVEVDETWIGGSTRGEGRGVHNQVLVAAAVEVRQRPAKKGDKPAAGAARRGGRYAGRLRMEIVRSRHASALGDFVEQAVPDRKPVQRRRRRPRPASAAAGRQSAGKTRLSRSSGPMRPGRDESAPCLPPGLDAARNSH